jgi:DNA polymerase-3 subunit alpha
MADDFPGHEDALRRTLEVAERCSVELELGRILLPRFPTPDGRDAFSRRQTASASAWGGARPRAASSATASRSPSSTRILFELLFERFLNPGRMSMPDMDIDFAVAGRERVIN